MSLVASKGTHYRFWLIPYMFMSREPAVFDVKVGTKMATAAAEILELAKPRWSYVRERADRLTAPYSVPPIPVLEIAERAGVDVVFNPFDQFRDTVAGFCDLAARRLYINSKDALNPQTFTIAHELGHWILHREYFEAHPDLYHILPRYQEVEDGNAFEKEANHFAAHLLVPKRLLTPVKDAPVAALAQAFAVSQAMMENRLKNA